MQLTKKDLRKLYIQKRKLLSDKPALDDLIVNNLLHSDLFINADSVFCYVSLPSEISTDSIINTALNFGKTVAVPYCVDNCGTMEFYQINSLDDLVSGSFNIREPDISTCKAYKDYDNAICIVPAICFDKKGNRIGYGKGYYDRFLRKFTSATIGLCYNEFIIDKIPADNFDMQVDYIITEKGITTISTGGKNG